MKVSNRVRRMLSKHFTTKILPKIAEPLDAKKSDIKVFWESCSKEFKQSSLCFFSEELIELVDKTNNKLLCAELLAKASESAQKKRS